jgi:hypothetical protein
MACAILDITRETLKRLGSKPKDKGSTLITVENQTWEAFSPQWLSKREKPNPREKKGK